MMCTMKVCERDVVVVVDLVARKVVFSLMDEFKTEGHGSTLCLRDNHVVIAVENEIYSVKY